MKLDKAVMHMIKREKEKSIQLLAELNKNSTAGMSPEEYDQDTRDKVNTIFAQTTGLKKNRQLKIARGEIPSTREAAIDVELARGRSGEIVIGDATFDAMESATVRDLIKNTSEKTPSGKNWISFQQFKAAFNIGKNKGYEVLRHLLESKQWESFEGYTCSTSGKVHRRTWYRPIPKGKK